MKLKGNKRDPKNESYLELKYCERCGGLWLRPVGLGRVYCEACERVVAEMPPVCRKTDGGDVASMPRELRWIVEEHENVADYEGSDLDATGGVA
jgi:hypothetical protein